MEYIYLVLQPTIKESKVGYWYKAQPIIFGAFTNEEDAEKIGCKIPTQTYKQHNGKIITDEVCILRVPLNATLEPFKLNP